MRKTVRRALLGLAVLPLSLAITGCADDETTGGGTEGGPGGAEVETDEDVGSDMGDDMYGE